MLFINKKKYKSTKQTRRIIKQNKRKKKTDWQFCKLGNDNK
jgi:hypothetical protein